MKLAPNRKWQTMRIKASGIEHGQRKLNGPQTTGRDYVNLSAPEYGIARENSVKVPVRDGTILLADIWRPNSEGRFPALLAAAPYPRQIQDLGAPAGVIEAGTSDFFVPRGYVHVIVNLRGTGGSGGRWEFFDNQEREDLYDIVEWVAAQPWSDGNVGMIGISYYAMSQMEAATQRPPHLKAIFPFDITVEGWEAANHNGLFSSAFITPWISTLGVLSRIKDGTFRHGLSGLLRRILAIPAIHRRFASVGGDNVIKILQLIGRFHHETEPWTQLWRDMAVEHPFRDEWWDQRDLRPLLGQIDVPTYLGSEWPNVPLHLPGVFEAWDGMRGNPNVRMSILGERGLPWPWESMHIEALAWFDQWLKGRETGILDGPAIRYWLPGAEKWMTSDVWPPASDTMTFALNPDGQLGEKRTIGERQYLCIAPGTSRSKGDNSLDIEDSLTWMTEALTADLIVVGHIELELVARATAPDTAWIVSLKDVAPDGTETDVTQGWLRATLREVDEKSSTPGRPVLVGRRAIAVPINEMVTYRIPVVPNARRFAVGHRIQLTIFSDDSAKKVMQSFRHTAVGTSSLNTISSASRLLLPELRAETPSELHEIPR
jgi:predicted acyl esterase